MSSYVCFYCLFKKYLKFIVGISLIRAYICDCFLGISYPRIHFLLLHDCLLLLPHVCFLEKFSGKTPVMPEESITPINQPSSYIWNKITEGKLLYLTHSLKFSKYIDSGLKKTTNKWQCAKTSKRQIPLHVEWYSEPYQTFKIELFSEPLTIFTNNLYFRSLAGSWIRL